MPLLIVAETIGDRLEEAERLNIGLLLRRIGAARCERNGDVLTCMFCSLLDTCVTRQDDQIGD